MKPATINPRQLEIILSDFRANGWAAQDAENKAILNAYWTKTLVITEQ